MAYNYFKKASCKIEIARPEGHEEYLTVKETANVGGLRKTIPLPHNGRLKKQGGDLNGNS